MRPVLILFILFPFSSICQSDTVTVWLGDRDNTPGSFPYSTENPRPYQIVANGKNGYGFVDSIRVCSQAIKSDTSQYYLIVYSSDSLKVLEGDFYGTVSNGSIITYDRYGRKTFEGQNELRYNGKKNIHPYAYPIGTNRTYTYKNHRSIEPESIVAIIYEPHSKKFVRITYDEDGKILTQSKGKR